MSRQKQDEIRQLMHAIGEAFSKLDFDAWLALFSVPRMVISKGVVFSSSSDEDTRNVMMPVFDSLRRRGFSHTRLDKCQIKLLSDTTAVASTVWTRLDGDGGVIETLGATYTLVLSGDTWKVAVVASHRADVMVVEAEESGSTQQRQK